MNGLRLRAHGQGRARSLSHEAALSPTGAHLRHRAGGLRPVDPARLGRRGLQEGDCDRAFAKFICTSELSRSEEIDIDLDHAIRRASQPAKMPQNPLF